MIVKEYQLKGMTCSGCEAKVKHLLLSIADINAVEVSKENDIATLKMNNTIAIQTLQSALGGNESKYQISEKQATVIVKNTDVERSWLETYKPILLVFSYIAGISYLFQAQQAHFNLMQWMQHFMAGFFLVFSFFKLLNLKAFAASYAMYDIIAKRFSTWGYLYAFIELGLGVAYLINFKPFLTNSITLLVMSVSIIGVLETVVNKKKIQCACLGTVFNLPMSTVTIVEDGLMILMSAMMLMML
jgi:cation transport ATPase